MPGIEEFPTLRSWSAENSSGDFRGVAEIISRQLSADQLWRVGNSWLSHDQRGLRAQPAHTPYHVIACIYTEIKYHVIMGQKKSEQLVWVIGMLVGWLMWVWEDNQDLLCSFYQQPIHCVIWRLHSVVKWRIQFCTSKHGAKSLACFWSCNNFFPEQPKKYSTR